MTPGLFDRFKARIAQLQAEPDTMPLLLITLMTLATPQLLPTQHRQARGTMLRT